MTDAGSVSYRRRKSVGVLHLNGIVDIFEAVELHAAARAALEDAQAATVRLDLEKVERMDASAVQILIALGSALAAQGRTLGPTKIAPAPESLLARIGIVL